MRATLAGILHFHFSDLSHTGGGCFPPVLLGFMESWLGHFMLLSYLSEQRLRRQCILLPGILQHHSSWVLLPLPSSESGNTNERLSFYPVYEVTKRDVSSPAQWVLPAISSASHTHLEAIMKRVKCKNGTPKKLDLFCISNSSAFGKQGRFTVTFRGRYKGFPYSQAK